MIFLARISTDVIFLMLFTMWCYFISLCHSPCLTWMVMCTGGKTPLLDTLNSSQFEPYNILILQAEGAGSRWSLYSCWKPQISKNNWNRALEYGWIGHFTYYFNIFLSTKVRNGDICNSPIKLYSISLEWAWDEVTKSCLSNWY